MHYYLPGRVIQSPAIYPSSAWDEESRGWNQVASGKGIHSRFLSIVTSSLGDLNLAFCYINPSVLTAVLFGFLRVCVCVCAPERTLEHVCT